MVVCRQRLKQGLACKPGISDDTDCGFGVAAQSGLVDINMDDLEPIIDAPGHLVHLQPGADREHHVTIFPQLVAEW